MNPDGARRHKGQGKPVVCNSRSKNERCRQDFNVKDIANPRVLALARRDFFRAGSRDHQGDGKRCGEKGRVNDERSSLDAPQKDIAPPMLS
jgi:hypothetical protein